MKKILIWIKALFFLVAIVIFFILLFIWFQLRLLFYRIKSKREYWIEYDKQYNLLDRI